MNSKPPFNLEEVKRKLFYKTENIMQSQELQLATAKLAATSAFSGVDIRGEKLADAIADFGRSVFMAGLLCGLETVAELLLAHLNVKDDGIQGLIDAAKGKSREELEQMLSKELGATFGKSKQPERHQNQRKTPEQVRADKLAREAVESTLSEYGRKST